jgi:hypothetical protein
MLKEFNYYPETEFEIFKGAQESIPWNQFLGSLQIRARTYVEN